MSPFKDIKPGAIVTYTGRMIEPLNPDPAEIDILDIAHALSNQCRFTGHTHSFYSVAQHSVLVSQNCAPEDALWGLLHDASEAYLSDMARPVKKFTPWGKGYLEAESRLMEAVCVAFDLPATYTFTDYSPDSVLAMPKSVKAADDLLLRTEMRDLMPEGLCELEAYSGDTLEDEIDCWAPAEAKKQFLNRYKEVRFGFIGKRR